MLLAQKRDAREGSVRVAGRHVAGERAPEERLLVGVRQKPQLLLAHPGGQQLGALAQLRRLVQPEAAVARVDTQVAEANARGRNYELAKSQSGHQIIKYGDGEMLRI